MVTKLLNTSLDQKKKETVTTHSKSEEKIQFSELRYRRLFETAQDGILILDADSGKIVDSNPFLKKLLGYSKKELFQKELWQIGAFKDIVDSKAALWQLQSKGYIRYKDLPLQTKKGKLINVEFISNVYTVNTKKVIQCNIRDITSRKKIEKIAELRSEELEKLTSSQEKARIAMLNVMEDLESAKKVIELEKVKDEAMLESIGEGLIAVSNDRKITVVNKAAEEMLGWKMDELIGKEITTLPLEEEDGTVVTLEKRPTYLSLNSGRSSTVTYFFVKKDKTRFPMSINVTPIKLDGKTIGLIEILRDITREMEVDKAKTEFVSLASHQLRTPLGIMKWYLEALEGEDYLKNAPKETHEYFDEIYRSNERVLSLVRDLLSVSRIDQGQVKNDPKLVQVTTIVKEIVEQMQLIARKNKVNLTLNIKDKIDPLKIDNLRFHEVIENLIANAIEYTPSPGSVEVIFEKIKGIISISVKDSGIGISVNDSKKLFTKFFRAENATTQNPEGSGLGLYVVKSYVEGWGGKISVDSKEGKGSTFTISLPIS